MDRALIFAEIRRAECKSRSFLAYKGGIRQQAQPRHHHQQLFLHRLLFRAKIETTVVPTCIVLCFKFSRRRAPTKNDRVQLSLNLARQVRVFK